MNNDKRTPLQMTVRILIIIGLVIVLLFLSFGIIKLVPKILNGFTNFRTSLFSWGSKNETLTVSTDPVVFSSGDNGTLTWTQSGGATDGYYTLEYACNDNKTIVQEINSDDSNSYTALDCGQPFTIGDATTTDVAHSIPLHITNTVANYDQITETLIVSHRKPNGNDVYSEGETNITIYPKTEAPTASEAQPTVTAEPAPSASSSPTVVITPAAPTAPLGPADLAVTITRLGVIDPRTNRFIETSTSNPSDRVAMQFQVTNLGQRASGIWRFTAYLPTNVPSDQIYSSAFQSSIPSGKTSYFTIGFYGLRSGTNELRIVVDPQNAIPESNEANNETSATITTR